MTIIRIKDRSGLVFYPEDVKLTELVEAEHIAKTPNGRYYLTPDGQMVAKGTLELYPELKGITTRKS